MTIVVPARDEVGSIERALAAIARQRYPKQRLEVLVVDGGSTDGTGQVAAAHLATQGYSRGRVLVNPAGTTPTSLNLGMHAARGEYVCRIDARSLVPPDYVQRCVQILAERPEVVAVGGRQQAIAASPTIQAQGIARALNNRWSTGLARYRRARSSGSSDTVYLGAFRTSDLRMTGGWDERLHSNQDFDLNRRLGDHGVVWFEATLPVGYLGRKDLRALWRQYVRFGRWKVEYWRLTGRRPETRQLVPIIAVPIAALAAFSWTMRGDRLLIRALATGGLVTSGLVVVDALGARDEGEERRPGPAVRLAGVMATATVVTGWCWGVLRGLVQGRE